MKRSEIRELTFKLIYSLEIQKEDNIEELVDLYIEDNEIQNNDAKLYIKDCAIGIKNNEAEINELIQGALVSEWKIDRISKISLSLLKLAIYEIKYKNIPYKVEINEVVELSKIYGEDKSSKFINGALAKIVNEIVPE